MGSLQRFAALTALVFIAAGCGSSDGGNDPEPINNQDSGADVVGDTALDVKSDKPVEASTDAPLDAKDAGKDAPADAKTDAKDAQPDVDSAVPEAGEDGAVDEDAADGETEGGETDGGETDGAETDGETDGGETDGGETDGSTSEDASDEDSAIEEDAGLDAEPDVELDVGPDVNCVTDQDCSDGIFCNGLESCDPNVGCKSGVAPNCDDLTSCTIDSCDNTLAACVHAVDHGACSDGLFCSGEEKCDPDNGVQGTGCVAGTPPSCNDDLSCTTDSCDNALAQCVHTAVHTECNDGKLCNGEETCDPVNGVAVTGCKAGVAPSCDDTFSCTTDTCDDVQGCLHAPVHTACNDGKYCNGEESCDPQNGAAGTGCKAGTAPSCDDTFSCTADSCDTTADACVHAVTHTACNDGEFCNGEETCDPQNGAAGTGCVAGTAPSCDDALSCTNDSCDANQNQCVHVADSSKCNDGLVCNGVEVCDPANGAALTGCKAGTNLVCNDNIPCTNDSCKEPGGCLFETDDTKCNDGLFCTGVETCSATLGCQAGTAPSCDDGILCTADACSLSQDKCVHAPTDAVCQDASYCNGAELCDPVNGNAQTGCKANTPVNCNDNVACTDDACSETLKACTNTANNALCNDGMFCNGAETCSKQAGCVSNPPPNCDDNLTCTSDACNETLKQCTHTPTNAVCDDGLYCNGVETCVGTSGAALTGCASGPPPPCPPDGISCTVDVCDEATQSCVHTPSNALCAPGQVCVVLQGGCTAKTPCTDAAICQDGDLCNGVETCTAGVCEAGTPVNCDDGVGCTVDSCAKSTGVCTHTPNASFCDDGLACNGVETCHATNDCQAGTPVNCADTISCTQDSCNEPTGTCTHTPYNYLCSDGKLCNGEEVCDPTTGCKPGPAYVCPTSSVTCVEMVCDPVVNACKPIPKDNLCPCGQTCDPNIGCGNFCQQKTCQGKVYECGDCVDNDGDCSIDAPGDSMCLGPCDNSEDSYHGLIPGANQAPCKADCYFDGDSGAGNDDCFWTYECDPYEVAPGYDPAGSSCKYDPTTKITPTLTCSQAMAAQSQACLGYCSPLTPNGCDCFGCCVIPGAPTTVWLNSENPKGTASCEISTVTDPTMCRPCTQVTSCLNTCAHCELCVGKTELPADCITQTCDNNRQPCGLPGQAPCPSGETCITGCCQTNPS